ncbi:fimbrial protein [Pantoea agglomerans]|uniref:fimbrial protein n=1 Tax=Enterobacter agglomerans TaxID=549 RepID=UPI003C79A639
MKLSLVALATGLGMTMVSVFAQAAGGGGTVNFNGEIIDAPCSIAPESVDQTVSLGKVSATALKNGGEAESVPFKIKLLNCDLGTVKTVTATWGGTESTAQPGTWGLTGTAAGAGIVLRDVSFKAIKPGEVTAATGLNAGGNVIAMSATLRGDSPSGTGTDAKAATITPGTFTSVASFSLTYQ